MMNGWWKINVFHESIFPQNLIQKVSSQSKLKSIRTFIVDTFELDLLIQTFYLTWINVILQIHMLLNYFYISFVWFDITK